MGQFLNLTHHPSTTWNASQLQAAQAIAPGTITDMMFPDVDPALDEAAVRGIGLSLLSQIVALGPHAALVQGEPVLTFFLVNELERLGIACYAASTKRQVVESSTLDGHDQKLSIFDFVRFRRYALAL